MSTLKSCDHCHEPIVHEYNLVTDHGEKGFCCKGCLSVYKILHENGLEEYYQLQEGFGTLGPAEVSAETYAYLDSPEFREKYLKIENGKFKFQFFVEGVHCVACLWLLEKLPEFNAGIDRCKLDMSNSILDVELEANIKLSEVARRLASIGYRPHPILEDADAETYARKEDRKALVQIGVAFAGAGNIMLYALAVYNGADGFFRDYFNLFTFIVSLPVLFYSAIPFYNNAYHSLKNREPSIDVPIAIAILAGLFMGVYSLISNKDYFYFDTLTTLVFLLLFSRYILRKTQQKSLKSENLSHFFFGESAKRLHDGIEEEVLTSFLKTNDLVCVYPGEVIPIDGEVVAGESHLNNSLLTGEIIPTHIKMGEKVYMGAKNLERKLVLKVEAIASETRLGKILQEIEQGWKAESKISLITDKISKRFVYFVFGLAAIFFLYFSIAMGLEVALNRTLTLLIITCPCALALTTPLALILGLSAIAKAGIIVKNEQVLEKLAEIQNVFLDKTGTLTHGDFEVIANPTDAFTSEHVNIIYSMESKSSHPIASSLVKYLEINYPDLALIDLAGFQEIPGHGLMANFANKHYEIKAAGNDSSVNTVIGLFEAASLIIEFEIVDRIRLGVDQTVAGFKQMGIRPHLLSGDKKSPVLSLAKKLPFESADIHYEVTPEQKRDIVLGHPKSLMVGDGVNDAVALKAAYVGVAVRGSVEVSLRAADVYLSKANVNYILNIVKVAKYLMKIIYRNLAFSLIYNLIGVFLAFSGQVTPLVAAILMPLSSLTVLVSTVWSIKRIKSMMD